MSWKNFARDSLVPLMASVTLLLDSTLSRVFEHSVNPKAPTENRSHPLFKHAQSSWRSRELTAGEAMLASRFFGTRFNLNGVKIYNGGVQPEEFWAAAQAFNPKDMAFYGPTHYSEDYSLEADPWKFGIYFHEGAHLDHHQNEVFTPQNSMGDCFRLYEYVLTPGKRYEEYCIEQQATLVEDYARRFLMDIPGPYRHGILDEKSDELLATVIEQHFPGAAVLRAEALARRVALLEKALPPFLLPEVEIITSPETSPEDSEADTFPELAP